MLPLFLDLSRLRILFVGQGDGARKRVQMLRSFGAENIAFYDKLVNAEALLKADLVIVSGLEEREGRRIAELARGMGKLVNVEDDPQWCDFYYASSVRRGDLTIAVGTAGKSPTLARAVRDYIAGLFNEGWAGWLDRLAAARDEWRAAGDDMDTVARKTREMIESEDMQPVAAMLKENRGNG